MLPELMMMIIIIIIIIIIITIITIITIISIIIINESLPKFDNSLQASIEEGCFRSRKFPEIQHSSNSYYLYNKLKGTTNPSFLDSLHS